MSGNAIVLSGRTFVALRKSGRTNKGRQPVYHAVTPQCRMALCAVEPGAGSDWTESPAGDVTCPACLKRLARLGGTPVRAQDGRTASLAASAAAGPGTAD